jgi:antitoxin PrlF
MSSSTITQKGQVTIPAELRKSLGIEPGDRLSFSKKGSKIIMIKKKFKVEQSFGVLKGSAGVSIKAMKKTLTEAANND